MSKVIKYRLLRVSQLLYELAEKKDYTILPEDCEITLSIGARVDMNEHIVGILSKIQYKDKRDRSTLLNSETEFLFIIEDFKTALEFSEETKKINIPDNFLSDLINISIGTTRGILIERNKDNYLEHVYVPLFNIREFVDGIKEQAKQ